MSKKDHMIKAVIAVAAAAALGGCATTGMQAVEKEHDKQVAVSDDLIGKAFAKTPKDALISRADTFWVSRTPLPTTIDPASQLPPVFSKKIKFNQQATKPLSEVFVNLSNLPEFAGMRFTVAQDVYESDSTKLGMNVNPAASASPKGRSNADSASSPLPMAGASASAGGAGAGSKRVEVLVSNVIFREGTVAELLDQIATKTNLAWRFDGEKISFFRYESRIFRIDALSGALNTSSTISSKGSGSGGGGGSTSEGPTTSSDTSSSTSVTSTADLWADVSAAIQSQLSPRGRMSPMPSTGQVTITDTPDQLRSIDRYIKELNKSMGKQIAFNVNVYSVENSTGDGYGVDWTGVWSTLAGKYNLGYKTSGNTTGLGNLFSVNLINAANGAPSNWAGSGAIVGALSKLGKTSLVTSTQVTTLNNITVPVSVTTETGYLKESSTTVSGTSGTSQTSLTPGTVTSGFNMNLLPRVGDGNDLMVQFSMDLSDLVKLTTFTSPDNKSAIQLPQKNLRNFLQRVSMRSGETLILSGFQQTQAIDDRNGVGSPNFWGAGGSRNSSARTTTLVIIITPYVMAK